MDGDPNAPQAKTSLLEWGAFAIMIVMLIMFPIVGVRFAGLFGGLWMGVFAGVLAAGAGVWAVASLVDWIENNKSIMRRLPTSVTSAPHQYEADDEEENGKR